MWQKEILLDFGELSIRMNWTVQTSSLKFNTWEGLITAFLNRPGRARLVYGDELVSVEKPSDNQVTHLQGYELFLSTKIYEMVRRTLEEQGISLPPQDEAYRDPGFISSFKIVDEILS